MTEPVIVVVEDDHDTLEYMEMLLGWKGYVPIGSSTVDGVPSLIREVNPALVILDLELEQPDSGITLLRQLRSDPATENLPAILYSAHEYGLMAYRDELRALHCAMLRKPFLPDEMFELIESQLATQPQPVLPSTA